MVADDKYAIDYSGIGFLTGGVRAVPLAAPKDGKCYEPTAKFAYSGDYPLARYLRLYFNKKPHQPLDPAISEFIRFVLSKEGQTITIKAGFYPVLNSVREQDLKLLGTLTDFELKGMIADKLLGFLVEESLPPNCGSDDQKRRLFMHPSLLCMQIARLFLGSCCARRARPTASSASPIRKGRKVN